MTIKKRLILSNFAMIILPIVGLLITEIFLGYLFFNVLKVRLDGDTLQLFIQFRFIAMFLIIAITNGILTYYVSKSIITPIEKLSIAAQKIREGDLNYQVTLNQNDELGELSRTFESMRQKLQEAQKAQKQYEKNRQELIASISHDLKTPLTSIKGYIQGIQDGVANTPEKLKRYIHIISQSVHDLDGMIDELFLYSKLDLQKVPFHFEPVDLYAFFADFIEELSFRLENENGTATLSADPNSSYLVKADREKLRRAVLNILQNSLKSMEKDDKTIQVRLISQSDSVRVEMSDNGHGIPKENLPFIFESFYRADRSRNRSTGGSGLGLSIVKKIIEAHGGTIWAESECGKGTTISFQLNKVIS